ncbi:MAG: hypothetical protein LBT59_04340 [Clostridiales bacterium]|nr:hypothetical protein [Clostridiales bacterium]
MQYRIGILGTPADPHIPWSDENLTELKTLGFNTMQLNIAWGSRPADEPLNLEDVILLDSLDEKTRESVARRQGAIKHRVAQCKKHGLRSVFHFGAPYNGAEGYQGLPLKTCISDPETLARYVNLLKLLQDQVPGIDDLLLYTFDQDAWICSEFQCERCKGIPLQTRLAPFLEELCDTWSALNPKGILWWEPWEMSAGQSLSIIQFLPKHHFGLMIHSNIGEVQKTRPADPWFKNVARLAKKNGIPVVAELFLGEACEETEPLRRVPCPELTYAQLHAVMHVDGIVGIKEYYGLIPGNCDPCLAMAGQVFHDETSSLEGCLRRLAAPYGSQAERVYTLWKIVSNGYMLYPWDASWYAREVGKASTDHGWSSAFIRGQQAPSPSWESSRHSVFMKVDNNEPNPFMREDLQLRFELASDTFMSACGLSRMIAKAMTWEDSALFHQISADMDQLRRICASYAIHLRESNVAMLLRECGAPYPEHLLREMSMLLMRDNVIQRGEGRVLEIEKAFKDDPETWLNAYLLPTTEDKREKGEFSLTTR